MKWSRSIVLLLLLAVTGLATWQQARLKQLTTEAAALRAQLAQAVVAEVQVNSTAEPVSSTGQHPEESTSAELLRLRGEVTVLRGQLARAQLPSESQATAAGANLKTPEERIEAAKQKLRDVVAALKLPPDFSEPDLPANLSADDLQSYLEAKRGVEEAERLKPAKLEPAPVPWHKVGDTSPTGVAQ